MRFVPLHSPSLSTQQREWDEGLAQWLAGTHESFEFHVRYHHVGGFVGCDGKRSLNPWTLYTDDGNGIERKWFTASPEEATTVDCYRSATWNRPDDDRADRYMPDFDVPEDELGWCLYEIVSEGSPVTPVFATADELIEHLVTVGQDWDQVPMRRASAEAIVRSGGTCGSLVVTSGQVLQSDMDADVIAGLNS